MPFLKDDGNLHRQHVVGSGGHVRRPRAQEPPYPMDRDVQRPRPRGHLSEERPHRELVGIVHLLLQRQVQRDVIQVAGGHLAQHVLDERGPDPEDDVAALGQRFRHDGIGRGQLRELRPPPLVRGALAFEQLGAGTQATGGGEHEGGQDRGHELPPVHPLHREGPSTGWVLSETARPAGVAASAETSTHTQSLPRNAFTSATAARTGMVAASIRTSPGPTPGSITLRSSRTGISMLEASALKVSSFSRPSCSTRSSTTDERTPYTFTRRASSAMIFTAPRRTPDWGSSATTSRPPNTVTSAWPSVSG